MKMLFKRIEIPVIVQEFMSLSDAKGRGKTINCVPYGDSALAQCPVIARGSDSQIAPPCFEDCKVIQSIERFGKSIVLTDSLQDFSEDEGGDADALEAAVFFYPLSLSCGTVSKIVDENGRVDNNHLSYALCTRWLAGSSRRL
jgi:hypothetical protein